MPDLRVQTPGDPERLTGTLPDLPDGFVLTELTGIGRWAKLSHVCGDEHTFVGPSPERVRWYVSRHRCGPGRWDAGEQPIEPIAKPTAAQRLVALFEDIDGLLADTPPDSFTDDHLRALLAHARAVVDLAAEVEAHLYPEGGQ